jgi:hypothetical protein
MNRRHFAASTAAFVALLPLRVFGVKGWCRSDPIVRVDGKMYSITWFAKAIKADFDYVVYYADSADLVMSLPGDSVEFVQDDAGFSVDVVAYADGEEVESLVRVHVIGN